MRFEANWDTELINMLHSCDAGEYSALSNYVPDFIYQDIDGKKYEMCNDVTNAMIWLGST